jgi:adenylate kinase family enzyme
MRRVLVIGSGGAGKSTFATRLAALTGLPLVHLDALYWQRGWIEPSKELWAQAVERLAAAEQWIMDGNYGGTLEMRLAKCDTVIFLDLPRRLCLWRVTLRRIRFHGRARPDMTQGCDERLTWPFILWIWSYRRERRPKILRRLEELRQDQQAVVLRTDAEIEAFLHSVGPQLG